MPRLHLYRHEKALNENIHPFYKEQEGAGSSVGDEYALSPGDQLILDDLQKALEEKDITVLRDNLSRIASGMPDHQWSFEQIDAYLDNDLEDIPDFAGDLAENASLARDVDFVQQVSMAVSEQDIMELRASLEQVREEALSSVYETGQLEDYITGDMDPSEVASFESELALNPGLAAELALYREVDSACGEKDIMALRESLQQLSAETGKPVEYSFAGRLRRSKLVIPAIAASLALLLALSNLIGRGPGSANDIYHAYYSVYQPAGVFRSVDAGNEMGLALQKFNEKDYQGALDLLTRVAPSDQENPARRFYTGMARQELGKYPEAMADYQAVIENKDNLFVEQARWYTGLCLLQTGERKKAVRLFRQIRDEKGYYAGQAGEILGKLED
jgi:tetratricopeptide (TPR) repeat protein